MHYILVKLRDHDWIVILPIKNCKLQHKACKLQYLEWRERNVHRSWKEVELEIDLLSGFRKSESSKTRLQSEIGSDKQRGCAITMKKNGALKVIAQPKRNSSVALCSRQEILFAVSNDVEICERGYLPMLDRKIVSSSNKKKHLLLRDKLQLFEHKSHIEQYQ